MQKDILDIIHRGYAAYLEEAEKAEVTGKIRRDYLRSDGKGEKCDTILSTCEIQTDWIEHIESALPMIERAIRENRQFILREGDTVPIEKARRVSKTSVEHLARHSQLITREPEPGEDIIPEKILMTENVSTYAVYENRFLYMLLCYIRDFSEIKYTKICENANLFSTVLELDKNITDKSKKICLQLKYKEISTETRDSEEDGKQKNGLERIKNILTYADALLKTGLMLEVASAPPVKPPISRTNVLLQNTCFAAALELYDYLVAYNGDGYTIKELYRQEGSLSEFARNDYANVAELISYLSYRNGGFYEELEERYNREQENIKARERAERDKKIAELKEKIKTEDKNIIEYLLALEEKCADAQEQINSFAESRNMLRQAEEMMAEAEEIRAAADRETDAIKTELRRRRDLERLNEEKHRAQLESASADLLRKDNELKKAALNYREETEKLKDGFEKEYSVLLEKYQLLCARTRAKELAENDAGEQEDFTEKESFAMLEAEYAAFKKYFDTQWKKAKKRIRREQLWKKTDE